MSLIPRKPVRCLLPGFSLRLLCVLAVVLTAVFLTGSAGSAEHSSITLSISDQPLDQALQQLSKISGYAIDLHPGEYDNIRVSIVLSQATIEEAVSRILGRELSHAVVWRDREKKISITIFESFPEETPHATLKDSSGNLLQQIFNQGKLSGEGIRFEQMSGTIAY